MQVYSTTIHIILYMYMYTYQRKPTFNSQVWVPGIDYKTLGTLQALVHTVTVNRSKISRIERKFNIKKFFTRIILNVKIPDVRYT